MINISKIIDFKRVILLVGVTLFVFSGWSQKKYPGEEEISYIEIVGAFEARRDKSMPGVDKLIGDVLVRHDSVFMSCDSAYMYMDSNSIRAFDHVHIYQGDTVNLTGDLLDYNGNTRKGVLTGNVVFRDNNYIMYTPSLDFDLDSNYITYNHGAVIIAKKDSTVIRSRKGDYLMNSETFRFREDVFLQGEDYFLSSDTLSYNTVEDISSFRGNGSLTTDSTQVCADRGWFNSKTEVGYIAGKGEIIRENSLMLADSIRFDQKRDRGYAYDQVYLIDSAENIIAEGNYLFYDNANDYSMIRDSALLTLLEKNDTMFMHADTVEIFTEGEAKNIFAYHHAKIFRSDLQASADSILYLDSDSLFKLFGAPVLWNGSFQALGDSIYLHTENNKPKNFFLYQNAFVAEEVDSGEFYNQVISNEVEGIFADSELKNVIARGDAESIYILVQSDTIIDGVNMLGSPEIIMRFEDKELKTISYLGESEGNYFHPNHKGKSARFFNGFVWYDSIRPHFKEEVFIHTSYVSREPVTSVIQEEEEDTEKRVVYSNYEDEEEPEGSEEESAPAKKEEEKSTLEELEELDLD